jgi:hypothetical protein
MQGVVLERSQLQQTAVVKKNSNKQYIEGLETKT